MFFSCSKIHLGHYTLHWVVMSLQASIDFDNFAEISFFFWWSRQFRGVLVRYFVDCPSTEMCLLFSWFGSSHMLWEKDQRRSVHRARCTYSTTRDFWCWSWSPGWGGVCQGFSILYFFPIQYCTLLLFGKKYHSVKPTLGRDMLPFLKKRGSA